MPHEVYGAATYTYVVDVRARLHVIEKFKPIIDITYLASYIIKATITAGYHPGTYNLHITNPDGEHT